MAHANPYAPGQVETLEQARNELVKLADTVNQILDNQKLVQRDDAAQLPLRYSGRLFAAGEPQSGD